MIATALLLPYAVASLVCIATPGADSLGTLSVSIARGRRAGTAFAVGVGLGCLTHTLWATIGIAAVVAASEALFTAIKLAGAAYLAWLGVQSLRARGGLAIPVMRSGHGAQANADADTDADARADAEIDAAQRRKLLVQGFASNAVNPKVMLFFLAFLPQFVDPAAGPVWAQMALLGAGFALMTGLAYALLAASAGRVGQWLRTRPSAATWANRIAGMVFLGLALRLALAERR